MGTGTPITNPGGILIPWVFSTLFPHRPHHSSVHGQGVQGERMTSQALLHSYPKTVINTYSPVTRGFSLKDVWRHLIIGQV